MRACKLVSGLLFCLLHVACTREVLTGVDENDANRAVTALTRAGLDAEKVPDTASEGKFRILTARDDASHAMAVLSFEELPRTRVNVQKESSWFVTPEGEKNTRLATIAAQLESSLSSVDGVLDARVHLDVPVHDPLLSSMGNLAEKTRKSTASLLLRYRGTEAPLSIDECKKLVAGAVSGLSVSDVQVVLVPGPRAANIPDRPFVYLGPVAVARGSLSLLKIVLAVLLALVASLACAVVFLILRNRKKESAHESASKIDA